jgi:hypothetical protein
LGLVDHLAVVSHFGEVGQDSHGQKLHRSVVLAPAGLPVLGVPDRTALIREPDGSWRQAGASTVAVFIDGGPAPAGLDVLAGV